MFFLLVFHIFCCCYCCSGIQLIYWIAYKSINLLIRRIDVSLTIIIIICVCGYFIGQIYYFQSFHLHFFNHKIQTSNPNLSQNLKCNRKNKRNSYTFAACGCNSSASTIAHHWHHSKLFDIFLVRICFVCYLIIIIHSVGVVLSHVCNAI